jgi:formylmethanofuran dehydrogenase subunit C
VSGAECAGWRLRWKKSWRNGPPAVLDGSAIRPDRLASLSPGDLRHARIGIGGRETTIGELFEVEPLSSEDGGARIVVDGSPRFVGLGAETASGSLVVEGDCGERAGARMRGGTIIVRGNAGRLAGEELRGGEIVVLGNAGPEAGLSMRRGLIAVAGSAEELTGHHLLAGTILVARGDLALAGIEMRRGTIIGLESRARPTVGFTPAGPVRLEWLRILRSRLNALAFPLTPAASDLLSAAHPMEHWSGDGLSLGRGEILQPMA